MSTSSSGKRRSRSPSQSLQARSFSTIQAASPSGESESPSAAVIGLVDCIAVYAASASAMARPASRYSARPP